MHIQLHYLTIYRSVHRESFQIGLSGTEICASLSQCGFGLLYGEAARVTILNRHYVFSG